MAVTERSQGLAADGEKDKWFSVARIYYAHGLMCASHPIRALACVAIVVIICSLPFFVTTTGDVNSPKPWWSPWLNYRVPAHQTNEPDREWIINNASLMSVRTPKWFVGLPELIVYQVYVHSEVDCQTQPTLCDSSYYSLCKTTVAMMLDTLQKADHSCSSVLHPAVVKFTRLLSNKDTPPLSFSSYLLSPLLDSLYLETNQSDQLNSIKSNMSLTTIKELLYGGFWEESHLKEHNQRTEQGGGEGHAHLIHRFAVSLLLQPTPNNFPKLLSCVKTLNSLWPLKRTPSFSFLKHFYYETEWTLSDFAPLICLYSIVFLYITFSVGKIDLVRSKLGLGFTAVITVISSLSMSLGICTFFGLSITISGSEVYPFVVVVIGLENILVVTKAVISTDPGMEVKNRIAEGLSKEGGALLYNLLTVICLVSLGIFTFNYAMKEFCIIALVGILCDYFLQMVFFTTVLSIDIKRMELSDLKLAHHGSHAPPASHPHSSERTWRIPRRDRVNNFLVRGRYAQKFMMVVLLAYMISVLSKMETFHSFVRSITNSSLTMAPPLATPTLVPTIETHPLHSKEEVLNQGVNLTNYINNWINGKVTDQAIVYRSDENGFDLWCGEESHCWRPMVTTHWPHLLQYYNISLENKFITVLSPMMINYHLGFTPQVLFSRTVDDKSLLRALKDVFSVLFSTPNLLRGFTLLLVGIGVFGYLVYLWFKASSLTVKRSNNINSNQQQLLRAVRLPGNGQDIECVSIDSGMIVTVTMDNTIHVWDISLRQKLLTIDRKEVVDQMFQRHCDMMSRYIVGCEDPPPPVPPLSPSSPKDVIPPEASPITPPTSLPLSPPPPSPSPPPPVISSLTSSLISGGPSTIPQRILPSFLLKRFTNRKISPEKRDPSLLSSPPIVESIPEHPTDTPTLALPSLALPTCTTMTISSVTSPTVTTPTLSTFPNPNSNISRPLASDNDKPLPSSPLHNRSKSFEYSNSTGVRSLDSSSQWSVESISILSENPSELSYETAYATPFSPLPPLPAQDEVFPFKGHFSLFSQYTCNLALEYCEERVEELIADTLPPVWCMDASNGTTAVGCANGQVEVWNSLNGSLKFFLVPKQSGVTVLRLHPIGIITGHIDGSLHLISHHGHMMHSVSAHSKPISVLTYTTIHLVTGGYDAIVKIFKVDDFTCLRSFSHHSGHIVSLETYKTNFCVSGCSSGVVCYWDISTGKLVHQLPCTAVLEEGEERGGVKRIGVVKVFCSDQHIIALLRDNTVRVWTTSSGLLFNIIEMGDYTNDISLIDPIHIAIALQSQIVVYNIQIRREISRKQLETSHNVSPMVRHLSSIESSTLMCSNGTDLQLIPSGLKVKND